MSKVVPKINVNPVVIKGRRLIANEFMADLERCTADALKTIVGDGHDETLCELGLPAHVMKRFGLPKKIGRFPDIRNILVYDAVKDMQKDVDDQFLLTLKGKQ